MSLPLALGSKSVSSRPLLINLDDNDDDDNEHSDHKPSFLAEDGMTVLDPIRISDTPVTMTAACPLQEWMALATIEYYDMIMKVDHESEDDDDDNDSKIQQKVARHSTVVVVRIQISSLASPFSSVNREVRHRLTLPNPSLGGMHSQQRYLQEDDMDQLGKTPVEPSLLFSSDRQQLTCLIPYPRGCHSALVAFPLQRPDMTHQNSQRPPVRPKLPAYIAASSSSSSSTNANKIPEARGEPQWLTLPNNVGMAIRDKAQYFLYNITSICNATTQEIDSTKRRTATKSSCVLLAGCRDGSILGISFQPLLLAGQLYHPTSSSSKDTSNGASAAITYLSYVTMSSTISAYEEDGDVQVVGKLVALQNRGRALIFDTRMVLSSLHHENAAVFQQQHFDMDGTDLSATETEADAYRTVIHGESFHVVKTGRRNSLPANTRLSEVEEAAQPLIPKTRKEDVHRPPQSNPTMGNTGLLMTLEPCGHYEGNFCRAQWIVGSLLALLETPQLPASRQRPFPTNHARDRVAQVIGIRKDRPPQMLTELILTSEDLECSHTTFSLVVDNDESAMETQPSSGSPKFGNSTTSTSALLGSCLGMQYDNDTGCLAISSARKSAQSTPRNGDKHSSARVNVFVCLWHWKTNVLGFTANAISPNPSVALGSTLLFSKERRANRRRLVHIYSASSNRHWSRVRKDNYEMGVLSPHNETHKGRGIAVKEPSPMLLTSTSVSFAMVSQQSNQTSEIEWRECAVPYSYLQDYGCPSIAAMSSGGSSIAIASSRGFCMLECSPRSLKSIAVEDRRYLSQEFVGSQPNARKEAHPNRRVHNLPPRWHMFGNESEERAFRVLAMDWWNGDKGATRNHLSGDLLVAVIERHESQPDEPGVCYLACWSQRSLCSGGTVHTGTNGSSITSFFIASASFQFDLRQRRTSHSISSNSSSPLTLEDFICAIGVTRTPGCGLEVVVVTSEGPLSNTPVLGKALPGMNDLKSAEIASYYLSDTVNPECTNALGGSLVSMGFYVWTFQLASGKLFCWIVPFPSQQSTAENVSSKVMRGILCPIGTSTTWLQKSPTKTARDFSLGCMPHSSHGCLLSTGQASRKFHQAIAGGFDQSLFAPDFMEHEFLYPADIELAPPAYISSLAALIRSRASASSSCANSSHIQQTTIPRYLGGDEVEKAVLAVDTSHHMLIRSLRYPDAAFLALRLLLLRSTEQLADDRRKTDAPVSAPVLHETLEVIRNCSSNRLHFASLLLEVGRQLEPSCFPHLFPLPLEQAKKTQNNLGTARSSWVEPRTVNDFVSVCLADGSLHCSVSSLPILPGDAWSKQNCELLLGHCLQTFDDNTHSAHDFFFDFSTEERTMMGDIFRFGAKVEENPEEDVQVDVTVDDDPSDDDDSTVDSSAEEDNPGRSHGYFWACGMLNFSRFRSSKPSGPIRRMANIRTPRKEREKPGPTKLAAKPVQKTKSMACLIASLLVQVAVPDNVQKTRSYCWRRSASLAYLLLGHGKPLLPELSAAECTKLARTATGGTNDASVVTKLATLISHCLVACSSELGTAAAGKVLDLVLVLLRISTKSSGFDSNLPGLLVIGIAAGHASNRVADILDLGDRTVPFTLAYLKARDMLDS
ncbi:expressed unknown protein [Seminavis robusta]|uniref:Uncharacterized protein n=1 Tax=Seminavis robusta TaxID=568900 RepID=A0A9N8ET16_9STRA|nr:expressed unknown protein [Seminavis robusta]|eukprot:Sro1863_g302340.1 n/a (1613) ;mRNA; r:12257-17741